MNRQPEGLINVLLDKTAREDERDDAAMDLANYPTQAALKALLQIAKNNSEEYIILSSSGESIAKIWIQLNIFSIDDYKTLTSVARSEAFSVIKNNKSEWIDMFDLKE